MPWLVWLSGLSGGLWKSQVQFPVRAHTWVAGQVPSWGRARGNQLMYLFLFFSLPCPLSKKKKRVKIYTYTHISTIDICRLSLDTNANKLKVYIWVKETRTLCTPTRYLMLSNNSEFFGVVIKLWLSFLERHYLLEMHNKIFVDEIMSRICFQIIQWGGNE